MESFEIEARRRKLIDTLLFDEDMELLAGTITRCATGVGNILIYGDCLGPVNPLSGRHEPYENFGRAYGMHSFLVGPIIEVNDMRIIETAREKAIRMGFFLEEYWKDKGTVEDQSK